jgi:dTDP-4-amino-4,6-dideoxygalactose transaminase
VKVDLYNIASQHEPIQDKIDAAVASVFASGRFVIPYGEHVPALEEEIAQMCGARYGVGVNSGTDALLLAMAACGVGEGDEVITSPFTFVATAETICLLGAKPVFADIEPDTFNIDPVKLAEKITPRTKAILPVHLFGQLADMDALAELAQNLNLKLIGDGAQAIGAARNGRAMAVLGDASTLSFYPTKNLGACGDGGMVLTSDEEVYEELKLLRFHGSGGKGYFYKRIGYCSRLDEIQAAILRVKAPYLHEWNEARRRNATRYSEQLKGLEEFIALPVTAAGNRHIFHQYTIRVAGGAEERSALQKYLAAEGVASAIFYPSSLHLEAAYQFLGYKAGDFPISEQSTQQVLSLPIHPGLTPDQIDFTARTVRCFYKR